MLINPIIVLAMGEWGVLCTDVEVELESRDVESARVRLKAILERWRRVLVVVIIISVMHSC